MRDPYPRIQDTCCDWRSIVKLYRILVGLALTILIPSYFGPTLYTGGGGVVCTQYYLINTWLYKSQILQGFRDTLQGLRKHKVCKKSFVWLPWQLFDNMVLFANNCQNEYERQVFFKCSQKPQIRRC